MLLILLPAIAFPDTLSSPAHDIETVFQVADSITETVVPFLPTPLTKLLVTILIGVSARFIERRIIKKRHKEELEQIKRALEK